MIGLSDGERILTIRSAVLIQYTPVTDGRTDGWTDRRTELAWHIRAVAYMLSRVKTDSFVSCKILKQNRIDSHTQPKSAYNLVVNCLALVMEQIRLCQVAGNTV